jgi:hypothetical protein
LRDSIILFISASDVGTILIPGNLQGNASFKKEIGSFSRLDVNLNFQQFKKRNC